MSINCYQAKRRTSAYVDGRLPSTEAAEMEVHLKTCSACGRHAEQFVLLRSALHRLPVPAMPAQLQYRLRVLASKTQAEVVQSKGSRWQPVWDRWKFRIQGLMRPVALPATGGLLSAAMLFCTFVFMIVTLSQVNGYEIPLTAVLGSEPNLIPLELRSPQVVLSMSFDRSGRIEGSSYADDSPKGSGSLQPQRASITVPEFSTIFAMAQPVTGDIQIRFVPLGYRQ